MMSKEVSSEAGLPLEWRVTAAAPFNHPDDVLSHPVPSALSFLDGEERRASARAAEAKPSIVASRTFARRPASQIRRPASQIRRPASHILRLEPINDPRALRSALSLRCINARGAGRATDMKDMMEEANER
jgi:hypothetical protein